MYRLVEPSPNLEASYIDYISEWEKSGERIVPYGSRRDGKRFTELLRRWAFQKTADMYKKGFVPASLYFLIDQSGKIYGALQIRHELNDFLRNEGGHIGYGIRPSARRQGLATRMLALSLEKARALGLSRVLITCDKNNLGSAKTIRKNGGILENEAAHEHRVTQRYWIQL